MTVGPIIFADVDAREQLLDEGRVLTFRTTARTTGDTWWRKSRTGPKEGDCQVELYADLAGETLLEFLDDHAGAAGFESGDAWRAAIEDLNGGVPEEGYVYEVTLPQQKLATDGGVDEGSASVISRFKSAPPLVERWRVNEPESEDEIPELYGSFENGWRFEIKPIDGQTYYNLHVPLDELDDWDSGGQIEEWSFVSFERVVEDLWETLDEIDTLHEMKDVGSTDVAYEYGTLFEMLERENL